MSNHAPDNRVRLAVNCFKCCEGCVHLEYGNLMFSFTQEQFLTFAEVISETRRLLLLESEAATSLEMMPVCANGFVM